VIDDDAEFWTDAELSAKARDLNADLRVEFVDESDGQPHYLMVFVSRQPPHDELDRVVQSWCGPWHGCVVFEDGYASWVSVPGTDRYRPR
jgi:hypothetical protein